MTKKSLSDEFFYRRIFFLPAKFSTDEYFYQIVLEYFVHFLLKTECFGCQITNLCTILLQKTQQKVKEMRWVAHFLVFCYVSSIIFSKNLTLFQYLIDKIFCRSKVFVGKKWRIFWQVTNFFCRRIFFTKEIFHRRNFYRWGTIISGTTRSWFCISCSGQ